MITTPKPLISGSGQAVWSERLRRRTAQLKPTFGTGLRVMATSRGVSYTTGQQSGISSGIATFKIKEVRDNDLVCYDWDGGMPGTSEIVIARPWTHRRYNYDTLTIDGVTYTYVTAQQRNAVGSVTETHDIIPGYTVGAMIVAAQVHCVADPNLSWEWLDLNMDAREWARQVLT